MPTDADSQPGPPLVDEGCCKPFAWSANSVHRQAVQPAAPLRRRAHGWRPVVLTSAKRHLGAGGHQSPVETSELRDERHIAVIGTSYRLRISYSLPQNLTHTQVGARRRSRFLRGARQGPFSNVPISVTSTDERCAPTMVSHYHYTRGSTPSEGSDFDN